MNEMNHNEWSVVVKQSNLAFLSLIITSRDAVMNMVKGVTKDSSLFTLPKLYMNCLIKQFTII